MDANEEDAFIVALSDFDIVVVIQETSEPYRKTKVKIQDACIALNVKYLNMMEMFIQLKEIF